MLQMLIRQLEKIKIAKNASILLISHIVSYGLSVVYIAALARYVGADGIGKISIANSINGLLIMLVAPGLVTLMVRDVAADHKKSAAYITNMFFMRLLLCVPFALLTSMIAHLVGYSTDTVTIIRIYILVFLLDSLTGILFAAFQAFERMEFEAAAVILYTVSNVSLSLLVIHLHGSLKMIAIISVISQVIKLLFMLSVCWRSSLFRPIFSIDWSLSKSLFVAGLPFGFLVILFTIKNLTASFILSLYRTENEVGIYSAANTILTMILFVPGALSTAIFPAFSRLMVRSRKDLQHFYQLCFKYLLVLGFPLGMGTILIGRFVLLLIYGEKFEDSVIVLNILALFLFTIVGYSNGPLLNATGRHRFFLWTEGLAVLCNGVLCILLVPKWGPTGVAMAFVIAGVGTFLIHSIASHKIFDLTLPWLTICKILLATLFMSLVVSVSLKYGVSWPIAAIVLGPLSYVLPGILFGILKRDELLTLAGRQEIKVTGEGDHPLKAAVKIETIL